MNDLPPGASPPEEPHQASKANQEVADTVVLAWAAMDVLIAL